MWSDEDDPFLGMFDEDEDLDLDDYDDAPEPCSDMCGCEKCAARWDNPDA